MAITVNVAVTHICGGGNHVRMTATAGNRSAVLTFTRGEEASTRTENDLQDAIEDLRKMIIDRVRSSGARTGAEIKAAIEGAAFTL